VVRGGDGTIVVRGATRFGRLILADASVDGESVRVVVDTGSAVTVGNNVLRDRLARRDEEQASRPIELTSVTGGVLRLDYTRTSHVRLGGMHLMNLPIGFSDALLFRELGLEDRPAILLGMDALRLFRNVSIDFASRQLQLVPGLSLDADARQRVAEIHPPLVTGGDRHFPAALAAHVAGPVNLGEAPYAGQVEALAHAGTPAKACCVSLRTNTRSAAVVSGGAQRNPW